MHSYLTFVCSHIQLIEICSPLEQCNEILLEGNNQINLDICRILCAYDL